MNRRQFLISATTGAAMTALTGTILAQPEKARRFKAVAFDAFPIFDPRPIFRLATELVPAKGDELVSLWRTRQFEYTWLRTLSARYVDFPTVTREALDFAARALGIELGPDARNRLLQGYFHLQAWPDALPALQRLKQAGLRLGFLSNFSREMLVSNTRTAGLERFFEKILSTDQVRAFKPDPRAYQMGVDAFGLPPHEIVFAAFAGWDAAGAKAFGYPTFWVNRLNSPEEELGARADATGTIEDLVKFATV